MVQWWIGAAFFVGVFASTRYVRGRKPDRRIVEIIQGDSEGELRRYKMPEKKPGEFYLWGNEFLTEEQASLHFLAVGSTGSGKTINILLLMKSVVERIREDGTGVRALVYDSKNDLLSTIKGMGLEDEKILIFNPFDKRRLGWDIAKDIRTPAEAEDLATLFVPTEKGESNPYFTQTAQRFLSGVIRAFQQNAPGQWTLRDLVLSAKNPEYLQAIFRSSKYTVELCRHFEVQTTSENIRSTLDSRLLGFESIAASWQRAEKKISIDDWLNDQKVLVIGNSPKAKDPIKRVNQLLFTSISKAIIGKPGKDTAKHWLFLDELRELGRLDYLADMMIVGRSKGASMVLGFQDVHGVYSEYGQEIAKELIGCAQNFALLRISATQPDTQKWASDVAGQLRYREQKTNVSTGQSEQGTNSGTSTSYELRTDPLYIPSYFSREIPQTSMENGMLGIYYTKGNLYEQPFPGEVLFTGKGNVNRVPQSDNSYDDHIPISDEELLLEPWDESDLNRLGISHYLNGGERIESQQNSEQVDMLDHI